MIIGAMIIAPLMNPILSMSFAIVTGNWTLYKRSWMTVLLGVFFTIFVSYLITGVAIAVALVPLLCVIPNPDHKHPLFFISFSLLKTSCLLPPASCLTSRRMPLFITGFGLRGGLSQIRLK